MYFKRNAKGETSMKKLQLRTSQGPMGAEVYSSNSKVKVRLQISSFAALFSFTDRPTVPCLVQLLQEAVVQVSTGMLKDREALIIGTWIASAYSDIENKEKDSNV